MNRSQHSYAHGARGDRAAGDVTIRRAGPADEAQLRTLAALDSARPLEGERLVAEVDGRLVAAVSKDGRAVADPFVPSAGYVELLRVRAEGRITGARRRRRFLGRLTAGRAAAAAA